MGEEGEAGEVKRYGRLRRLGKWGMGKIMKAGRGKENIAVGEGGEKSGNVWKTWQKQ
jgi:hypothetical protein